MRKRNTPSQHDLFTAFNEYRTMWILTFFDMPVLTKEQRRNATLFRKDLVADGFSMAQLSVYVRSCPSRENAEVHKRRVIASLPPEGLVHILIITDKQFAGTQVFYGAKQKEPPKAPKQLELFLE